MNKKMKMMIGLAAFSGVAAAAGFFAGRLRKYRGKHVRQGIPVGSCDFPMLTDMDGDEEMCICEEKHFCADEISDYSDMDAHDAARHILHDAKLADLSCLTEVEMESAEDLLSAYIGFLQEEAPSCEHNLAILLLLLVNTEDNGPGAEPDVVFRMITEASAKSAECSYYEDYQNYWVWTEDKWSVIHACQRAVADVLAERVCSE